MKPKLLSTTAGSTSSINKSLGLIFDDKSQHERKITDIFAPNSIEYDRRGKLNIKKSVFLCFTNRSGSNFLADMLLRTDKVPRAGEYLNPPFVQTRSKKWGCATFTSFLIELADHVGRNGVFATKVSADQLAMLIKHGYINNLFEKPQFVWIERGDILSQAISLSIAMQTQKWRSDQGKAETKPEYIFEDILKKVQLIADSNARFSALLNLNGARFTHFYYEDVCADPSGALATILKRLDIDISKSDLANLQSGLRIQSDSTNEVFRSRFLSEMSNFWKALNKNG